MPRVGRTQAPLETQWKKIVPNVNIEQVYHQRQKVRTQIVTKQEQRETHTRGISRVWTV